MAGVLAGTSGLLASGGCAFAAGHVTKWVHSSDRVARGLRLGAGLVIGSQAALVSWVSSRDFFSAGAFSATGIMLGAISLLGGSLLGLGAGFAMGPIRALWAHFFSTRLSSGPTTTLLALIAFAALFGIGRESLGLAGTPAVASPSRPNILLIVADTLRADHLGSYGGSMKTPNLDAIAAGGTRIDTVYAPASWTGPTTGTILTGLDPSSPGFLTYQDRIAEGRSIANVLNDAGYATAGITANPVMTRKFGFGDGFDRWQDKIGRSRLHPYRLTPLVKTLGSLGAWRPPVDFAPGSQVVDRALDWLQDTGGPSGSPFFLHLQFMDPHDPYRPPEQYVDESPGARDSSLSMEFGTLADISAGRLEVNGSDLARMKAL